MRFLDKIVLNRLINNILNFIISLIKIISPKTPTDVIKPKRKKILPWRNKHE